MPRVAVVHFEPVEAAAIASRLSREGFEAEACTVRGGGVIREIRGKAPDAVLIDLMRMPSYGRSLGQMLREQRATRGIPLVFIEGEPAKTRLVRRILPDAAYAAVPQLGEAIRRAIDNPTTEPVLPNPLKVPAAHKLRIGKDSIVGLVNAPKDFSLGKLPAGAKTQACAAGANVILLFVKSAAALGRELPGIAKEIAPDRKWWVLWPKKSSGAISDLSMPRIFEMCAPYGLAAHKLCAVDETWSALGLGRSRTSRGSRLPED